MTPAPEVRQFPAGGIGGCPRGLGHALRTAAIISALAADASPARAQFTLPTDFVDELVVADLPQVVGMAFLPDGRLLVVERVTARVRLIVNGALAAVDPVVTVPDVISSYGEEGLLGIAVDPGWPGRPYVYVQYTAASAPVIRIVRFTVTGDLAFTGAGSLTIDPASRYDVIADAPHEYVFHNGGTLRFGPDGMLYSSLGDYTVCHALSPADLLGKILRLDVSGLPPGGGGPAPRALITPPDNPFVAHADPNARLVWQWGLRNPFRFGIDPQTGAMVIGDVGQSEREELNYAASPGLNFQWPIYEGDIPGPFTCAGVDSSSFTGPILAYDQVVGRAVIGGVIYRRSGSAAQPFPPEYDGDIFYSDFYRFWLRRLKRIGNTWTPATAIGQPNATDWGEGATGITDWLVAPNGSLWYCRMLTGNSTGPGQIRRIRYTGVLSVPVDPVSAVEFRAPFPSPSRGAVSFEYALPAERAVALVIYDLGGRRVRDVFAPGPQSPGPQRAIWDGRDHAGRDAGAGVYVAVLTVDGERFERRFALVR